MKSKFFTLFIFLVFIDISILPAQTLNLQQAVDLAKNNNLHIKKQSSTKEASYSTMQAGKKNYLPTVSLYGGFTHLSDELKLDLSQVQESFVDGLSRQQVSTLDAVSQELTGTPLTGAERSDIYNSTSAVLDNLYPDFDARLTPQDYFMSSVFVNQPLFLGGSLNNANKIAKSNHEIASLSLQQTEDFIIQQTIIEYFTLLLFKDIIKTRESSLSGMIKHDSSTMQLVKAEIIPSFYEYGSKAAISSAESSLIIAKNEYESALVNFKHLINVAPDTTLIPNEELVFLNVSTNLIEAQQSSISYSPLIKMNQESQLIAQSNISMAKAGYLPNLFAVGEFQLYQENLPVITPPWMLGVQLKWDIFNGGRDRNIVQAAKLYEEVAAKNNQLLEGKLEKEVTNAFNKMESSKAVYLNQIKTKEFSRKNYESIQKQYKHGLVRSNEVIDAHILFEEAQLAEHEALFVYYLAIVELYALRGNLNSFIDLYENAN